MPSNVTRRPRTHREIQAFRRNSLIWAAVEVIAKHGIENASVAQICDAAGVSRGLINHYFLSKDDLLIKAIEALHQRIMEVTRAAASAHAGEPQAQLEAVVRAAHDPRAIDRFARSAYLALPLARTRGS